MDKILCRIIVIITILLTFGVNAFSTMIEVDDTPTLVVGPFVDFADGVTREDNVAIGSMDYAFCVESGGVENNVSSGRTWAELTMTGGGDSDGWYKITLTAADTNTLGRLVCMFGDADLFVPVWHEFTVVPKNIFEGVVDGTDVLQTDAIEISSSTAAANTVETNIGNLDDAITDVDDIVWQTNYADHDGTNTFMGYQLTYTFYSMMGEMIIDTTGPNYTLKYKNFYDGSDARTFYLYDSSPSPSYTNVFERDASIK